MKLGILDYTLDLSVRSYINNVVKELRLLKVQMRPFVPGEPLPTDADLYWDPRLTGGTPPWHALKTSGKPCVVTIHDGAPLSMPPWEYYRDLKEAVRGIWGIIKRLYYWRAWRGRCAAIITVSESAKAEIEQKLGLRGEKIVSIYHGVDHTLFRPIDSDALERSHLLHISQYQPKKNVTRIFAAYERLPHVDRPPLIAVVPKYPTGFAKPGLSIIRKTMSHEELVPLYQNAMGFVFPSLHETFGMPIIEAMACGCPVITSKISACAEVAGNAALLVNPRSVDEIAGAMRRLIEEPNLRIALRGKGIARAQTFTWRRSAEEHLKVFDEALRK